MSRAEEVKVKELLNLGNIWRREKEKAASRVYAEDPEAKSTLISIIQSYLAEDIKQSQQRPIALLCIGTDRSTGDSLGPLTGTKILESGINKVEVYGTLEEPVHATNLANTLYKLASGQKQPYIIAIDASLGRLENIGLITVRRGPLRPGTGVNKVLPPVGNLHITGVVNVGGYMEYFVLQNTRLSIVVKMANIIAEAVVSVIQGLYPT